MCFSPQRRAIFEHLNFKKWSEHAVFCTFSLENVLLATAACNFSTSELQKVVRSWRVLYIFTSKCASRHSGVQFLISPLTTWLRTRRFTEPTFRLTRHTDHWKNTAFRDFSNIWRGCIFFLLTFAQLHLLSSDFTSSHLLFIFNSPYCRKLLFKLPSTKTAILTTCGSKMACFLLNKRTETSHPWTILTRLVKVPTPTFPNGWKVGKVFFSRKPWICCCWWFFTVCTIVNHHFSAPFRRICFGSCVSKQSRKSIQSWNSKAMDWTWHRLDLFPNSSFVTH